MRIWRVAVVALLGLMWRPGAAPSRPLWRGGASGWEAPADAINPLQFGRAYQLPPSGHGNGLEALFWAPLARVPEGRVRPVLAVLAGQGVAAWTAPARSAPGSADLWTAAARLDEAQDLLMRVLAEP